MDSSCSSYSLAPRSRDSRQNSSAERGVSFGAPERIEVDRAPHTAKASQGSEPKALLRKSFSALVFLDLSTAIMYWRRTKCLRQRK
jgi:hypothetical protein